MQVSEDKLSTLTLLAASFAFPKNVKATMAKLRDELARIPGLAEGLTDALARVVEPLRGAGYVELDEPRASTRGKQLASEFLRVSTRASWAGKPTSGVRNLYLPTRILGLPSPPKSLTSDWLSGHVLNELHDLGLPPFVSLAQATSKLAWLTVANIELSDLAHDIDKGFSARALYPVLYRAASGREPPKGSDVLKGMGKAMLARDLKLDRREASHDDVIAFIYRRWIEDPSGPIIDLGPAPVDTRAKTAEVESRSPPARSTESRRPEDPLGRDATRGSEEFVEMVLAIARQCEPWTPRAADVYIIDVWDRFRRTELGSTYTYDTFKAKLAEEQRAHRILLLEGQLTAAMDATRRQASELAFGPFAKRHLIRTEAP